MAASGDAIGDGVLPTFGQVTVGRWGHSIELQPSVHPLEQKPSQGIPTSEDTIITADTDTEALEDTMEVALDMATDMEASGDTMEADSDTDTDTDTDTEVSEVTAISDDTVKNPQESPFLQLSCI
ncbi:unnamed protein product [Nippostrongylus brasiliensis]|uniref:Polyprotein protein n=1 Tax=Nippostrongylus brasiliensis TaxID=27835 RepID=A0A0N4XXQ7_NIPBR|nr:unnamed protein product [Nippostrongylus brasiliensis]